MATTTIWPCDEFWVQIMPGSCCCETSGSSREIFYFVFKLSRFSKQMRFDFFPSWFPVDMNFTGLWSWKRT